MNILLITEQRASKWNKTSFETLAAAQQIASETGGKLAGVVIGRGVAALADELAVTKLDEVLLVEHDLLEAYTPDGYTTVLGQVIAQSKPDLVLLPHTYQVRDFVPKLAASLGKGMIGDCIGYRRETFPSPKSLPSCWAGSWRHRARFAMKAGCRWSARSAAPARLLRQSSTWRWASAAQSSTWSG